MSASSDYQRAVLETATEKARALSQAASNNANIWGNTISTIGQQIAQYPEQQAKLKEIANRADLTNLEKQREQRLAATEQRQVSAQQQASQVLGQIQKTPDGLWDTNDLMQKLTPTGLDPQHIESLTTGFEKMNDMTLAQRKRQEEGNADLAHGLLSIYTKDEPITSDSLSFNAEALKGIGGLSDADAQAIHDMGAKVPPGTDLRPLLKSIEQRKKEYQPSDEYAYGANLGTYSKKTGNVQTPVPEKPEYKEVGPGGTLVQVPGRGVAASPLSGIPQLGTIEPAPTAPGAVRPAQTAPQAAPASTGATIAPGSGAQVIATGQPKPEAAGGHLWVLRDGKVQRVAESDVLPTDRKPPAEQSGNAQVEQGNAATVVKGLKAGTISPEVLLSTRATAQGMALNAEAVKQGLDTNQMVREWQATKHAIASLNGASQLRLAETINKASSSLDKLDELNQQWSQNASRWGVKVLNHANLKAAQNGAYGPEAASVAQRLEGQIADVTSELGQAIMGGNSPTDHAFGLASKNLSSDWTQKVLDDSIKQVRYNLNQAQNARNELLNQVGVQSTQVQTPQPGASLPPPATSAPPPTPAGRVRVKGPNGQTGTAPVGAPLPPGWSKE